jgi:DNA-binding HxlR family transcriptional regulator
MLTITLRNLERDGIISRRYFASVPPKVEYTLTSVGRTLLDPVLALVRWADQNQAVISQAQSRYDADARSIETD